MMLYRMLKRLVQTQQSPEITEKLDVFYAAGKLTAEQYAELTGMLEEA